MALIDGKPTVAFAANSGPSSSAVFFWQQGQASSSSSSSGSRVVFEDRTSANLIQWGSDRNLVGRATPVSAFYVDGTGLVLLLCFDASCEGIVSQPVVDRATFSTDLGLYASVAILPSTGFAVVAYHDAANLQLKMVLCQDAFCQRFFVRVFPSTVGWDPSVAVDSQTGWPVVAFSNPAIGNLVLMACAGADCSNASFSTLLSSGAGVGARRFEAVKLLTSRPITVVAHDAFAASLNLVSPAGSNAECIANVTRNCSSTVLVVITSPSISPFATSLSSVFLRGFLSPFQGNLSVVVNNGQANLTLDAASGRFEGSVQLTTGPNVLTVAALDSSSGKVLGAASVIVLLDLQGPTINITLPQNNTNTVGSKILVQGFASALSGVQSVVLLNTATGTLVASNSTSPFWNALVDLAVNQTNIIRATATDNIGQSASQIVVVVQQGLLAQLTCPGDFSIECGSVIPTPAVRVVNCLESVVLQETSLPTCGGTRSITRVASACRVACSYNVRLIDTNAPSISCPAYTHIACGDALPAAAATDACLAVLQVQVTSADCGTNTSRTYSVSDGCGNSASCSQFVSIAAAPSSGGATVPAVDTTSPAFSDGALGGLIAGLILLLLILLLAFLIAFCWLRRKKRRDSSSISSDPIMMAEFGIDEEDSSSVTHNRLYRRPPNQSDESQDFNEVLRK